MGFAVGLGFLYVWQYIQTSLIGYRLREVQLANAALRTELAQFRNQRAELAAPARIDGIARRELGMVRQGTWDLVMLPQPLVPAPAPLPPAPSFMDVQRRRWSRLAARVHRTLGPGRALAAAPDAGAGDE